MTQALHEIGQLAEEFGQAAKCPQSKPKRPSPITLRMTPAERAKLEELAQGMTLSAYIRMCVLQEGISRSGKASNRTDKEMLAQIIGLLGQSRIANNLNQIAKAANLGILPLDDQIESDIREAYAHVVEMRHLLLKALGLRETG